MITVAENLDRKRVCSLVLCVLIAVLVTLGLLSLLADRPPVAIAAVQVNSPSSSPDDQAVALAVKNKAKSVQVVPTTASRLSVNDLSTCVTADLGSPLSFTLNIRDTFGPRLLQPGEYSRYDFHRGLDWKAPLSTPVYAVFTGTVRNLEKDWSPDDGPGSGNFVHLIHGRWGISCETRYSHLSAVSDTIAKGITVSQGQIIGWVGDTGAYTENYHLHFEVRRGLTVTQRAAIHPLSTWSLPWANVETPTVSLLGVYSDTTGLTALVEVTSPYTEPDVTTVGVTVSGANTTDERIIDFVDLNANTTIVADLDDPLVNDVCIIPSDLSSDNDYHLVMAFRRLNYDWPAIVTARAIDVGGLSSTDVMPLTGGLQVTPTEQVGRGVPKQTVTFTYRLTNHTGTKDTFSLTHHSAQGWPAVVTPATSELTSGGYVTVTVVITVNTDRFGPPDCGLLVAQAQNDAQQVVAGFYRIYRDAYVRGADGIDDSDAGSMVRPFKTIGYAIGRTDAGGTIHVAEGTCAENLILEKTVNLLGSYATDWSTRSLTEPSTIVDGQDSGPVLTIDGDYGPLIEGLVFTNGHSHNGAGGGVRLVGGAAPTLRYNWILSNTADRSGGGIYIGPYGTLPPAIVGNTIAGNVSGSSEGGGGGIYVKDRPVLIQGNVIRANQAISNSGGGLYLTGDTTAQVLGNRVTGNSAKNDGGGVLVRSGGIYLANNAIQDNTAVGSGNGISIGNESAPRIYNNTLVGNRMENGTGIYIGSGSVPTVVNNIIADYDVGVHCSSPATISFSVLSNTTDLTPHCISFTNIITDPRLDDDKIHLALGSPAIDAGQSNANDAFVPLVDIDGQSRPADGNCDGIKAVDIGAAEYYGCIHLPVVLRDYFRTFTFSVSECRGFTTATNDRIQVEVQDRDIVVTHTNAVYNCCAEIVVDLVDERPLFKLIEREAYLQGAPCHCTCPYDISARILDLPPGHYQVEIWNWNQSHLYGQADVIVP